MQLAEMYYSMFYYNGKDQHTQLLWAIGSVCYCFGTSVSTLRHHGKSVVQQPSLQHARKPSALCTCALSKPKEGQTQQKKKKKIEKNKRNLPCRFLLVLLTFTEQYVPVFILILKKFSSRRVLSLLDRCMHCWQIRICLQNCLKYISEIF